MPCLLRAVLWRVERGCHVFVHFVLAMTGHVSSKCSEGAWLVLQSNPAQCVSGVVAKTMCVHLSLHHGVCPLSHMCDCAVQLTNTHIENTCSTQFLSLVAGP